MARHRDFGTGPDLSELEDVSFALHGETFHCYPAVSGGVILRFGHQTMDPTTASNAIMTFFASCMLPEEFERFNDLLIDPQKITKMGTITDIAGYLIEEYTSRPTQQSESSSGGVEKKKRSSTR